MTAPLTPPACDLRGLDYMPLDIDRFLNSDTVALLSPEEFKPAMLLWPWSWKQTPAASLPNDDRLLARAVGVTLQEWLRVRDMALRGWIECDDGRLYHPVVAEKALQAWIDRLGYRDRSAKAQAGRHASFVYQPEVYAELRREALICLDRLVPGSALASGIVLQGDETAPSRRSDAPARTPPRSEKASEVEGGGGGGGGGGGEGEDTSLVVPPAASPTTDTRQAFDLWNETAAELDLPKALKLDDGRRRKLSAILKAHGLDAWREALRMLAVSPHCLGQNDRGWRADLDFMLRSDKLLKVLEGGYTRNPSSPGGGSPSRSYLDAALENGGWQ